MTEMSRCFVSIGKSEVLKAVQKDINLEVFKRLNS